jgi:hypothetical protein
MRRAGSIGLALVLAAAGCSGSTPFESTGPTTTSEGIPALELTITPSLPAGRYTRSGFEPRITFQVDDPRWGGWQILDGFFDIQQDHGSPDVIAVQFGLATVVYGQGRESVPVTSASQAVDALTQNDGLVVTETSARTIDGHGGYEITVENHADLNASIIDVAPGTLSILQDRKLQVTFFDTPQGVLAVLVGGSTQGWAEALAAAKPVLDSVTIGR